MISVVNVSPEDAPTKGMNDYEVRINRKVICSFRHDRQYNCLAQCLRDAADAVDKQVVKDQAEVVDEIINIMARA